MKKFVSLGILGVGIFSILFGCNIAYAVPADETMRTHEQPSGEAFEAQTKGDEYFNYNVTKDGHAIDYGKDGYWHYLVDSKSRTSSNSSELSESKVGIDSIPSNSLNEEELIKKTVPTTIEIEDTKNKTLRSNEVLPSTHNLLVILVEFEDAKLSYSDDTWEKLIFDKKDKSLTNYYATQTKNRINIVPAKESYGEKRNGIIRIKLEDKHPNPNGLTSVEQLEITKKIFEKANDSIDYSQYDSNGDGKITSDELHLMTILAGYEQSFNNQAIKENNYLSVWGHKGGLYSTLGDFRPTLNGVKLNNYTQFGEKQLDYLQGTNKLGDRQATMGVIAHEFGHDLGLPDLYNVGYTNEDKSITKIGQGLGMTSLMAGGSWGAKNGDYLGSTPVGLDAYSKSLLGVNVETLSDTITHKLVQTIDEGEPTILRINSLTEGNDYFLIENRQFTGYDKGMYNIQNGGIAVYRINPNFNKNYTSGKQAVTLLEADEEIRGFSFYSQDTAGVADPFYYVGKGRQGEDQLTRLAPFTIPSNNNNGTERIDLFTGDNLENRNEFILDIESSATNQMYISYENNSGMDYGLMQAESREYFPGSETYKKITGEISGLNSPSSSMFGELTTQERLDLDKLTLNQSSRSIKGIEQAKNLTDLSTGYYSAITDYSPLKKLTKMKRLFLQAYGPYEGLKREEIDSEYLEPVNIDFVENMPDLTNFFFNSRAVLDLRPLSKATKLQYAYLQSSADLIELDPIVVKKDNSILFKNPVQYSSQFENAEITVGVVDYDANLSESLQFDVTGNQDTIEVKNISQNTKKISIIIYASNTNTNFHHSVRVSFPLVWE